MLNKINSPKVGQTVCLIVLFALFLTQAFAAPPAQPSPSITPKAEILLDLIQAGTPQDAANHPVKINISMKQEHGYQQRIEADEDGVSFKSGPLPTPSPNASNNPSDDYSNITAKDGTFRGQVCLGGRCRQNWPSIDCTQNLPSGAAFGYVAKIDSEGAPICQYYFTPSPSPSPVLTPTLVIEPPISARPSGEEFIDLSNHIRQGYAVVGFGAKGGCDLNGLRVKLAKLNSNGTVNSAETLIPSPQQIENSIKISSTSTDAYVELPSGYVATAFGFKGGDKVGAVYLRGIKFKTDGSVESTVECAAQRGATSSTCASALLPHPDRLTCIAETSHAILAGIGIGVSCDGGEPDSCRAWVNGAVYRTEMKPK